MLARPTGRYIDSADELAREIAAAVEAVDRRTTRRDRDVSKVIERRSQHPAILARRRPVVRLAFISAHAPGAPPYGKPNGSAE